MVLTCQTQTLRFALPKGRMYDGIARLLADAGVRIRVSSRDYRPSIAIDDVDVKILKPRAIVEMMAVGARDLGFAGADWVAESNADLVELIDTELDPVRLIAAAPTQLLIDGDLPTRRITVASEYVNLAQRWIENQGIDANLLRSYGATEVLPPEDADCIIDNTATGATLTANNLEIIDELMTSSTRLYATREAMDDPARRDIIDRIVILIRSVLEARRRVMMEFNVSSTKLDDVIDMLPCMREPTVAPMHGDAGYAVKAAVLRTDLPSLIPVIKERGGTDIVVTTPEQIVI
ncbi:MAG: ATP phosphoribosyltransferase [Planctomycetota bacterium]